jgi:hypothetical protein
MHTLIELQRVCRMRCPASPGPYPRQ